MIAYVTIFPGLPGHRPRLLGGFCVSRGLFLPKSCGNVAVRFAPACRDFHDSSRALNGRSEMTKGHAPSDEPRRRSAPRSPITPSSHGPHQPAGVRWNSPSRKSPLKPSREKRSRLLMLGQDLDKTGTTRHLLTASKAACHSRLN